VLRRIRDGHLVLFVVSDHHQLGSCRLDRMRAIRPTTETIIPTLRIEF
jgi:hypothetical protein